jgi:hypothetical protein
VHALTPELRCLFCKGHPREKVCYTGWNWLRRIAVHFHIARRRHHGCSKHRGPHPRSCLGQVLKIYSTGPMMHKYTSDWQCIAAYAYVLAAPHNHKGHFLHTATRHPRTCFSNNHTRLRQSRSTSPLYRTSALSANQLVTLADHCVLHSTINFIWRSKNCPVAWAVDQCIRAWFSRPADH